MSAVDPQLLQRTLDLIAEHDLAGANPREIIEWTLGTFEIEEQWQSLAEADEDSGPYEDKHSKMFDSADDLLAELGTIATDPNRALRHRFVLRTGFQWVQAHLDWRPV